MSFLKTPSWLRASPASSGASPRDQLRADLTLLETELAADERAISDLQQRMRLAEDRAMDAIRAGYDRAAHAATVEQQTYAEQLARLVADTKVLRGILDECREFTRAIESEPPRPSQD